MKTLPLLLLGIFLTIAFSFTGIILSGQLQIGNLKPVAMEEGEDPYPREPVGIAQQGKKIYIAMGCIYCHSQQVRRKGFGADHDRGWGDRQTVARDYIYQKRVLLGTMRTGPDLFNVGQRLSVDDWHYLHLYDPRLTSKGSVMPPFRFLFKKQKINGKRSSDALKFPPDYKGTPEEGYEIVPTERCRLLVAYLLNMKLDYELPESRFQE